ncbi:hypothetical protein PEPS_21770 [Persicobacter psychrovividus]|uniref:Uncharacterized protein n=1 Tax=Persicobacter psychrovividus TaxID=387638 RepID=A0ABN6LEP2_9BACT|nr:hypothetical protein PEPS_21770 [Persicobacter psychrovividus]
MVLLITFIQTTTEHDIPTDITLPEAIHSRKNE